MELRTDGLRTKGRLLVASPMLGDPNFRRAVVLMIEHSPEGALGVVLNRPTENPVAHALPGWEAPATDPGVVFTGGPVEEGKVLALGVLQQARREPGWSGVVGRVGMVDLSSEPEDLEPVVEQVRFFSGYAGWGAGQLEGEIAEGAWIVLDATEADALTTDPADLWHAVFRRQRGDLLWYAFYPDDPGLN
jgi:putative transcriptional regulator